ncbi:MAG: hypothetical protein MHMPM18_002062 [Marteilia pararefringens]
MSEDDDFEQLFIDLWILSLSRFARRSRFVNKLVQEDLEEFIIIKENCSGNASQVELAYAIIHLSDREIIENLEEYLEEVSVPGDISLANIRILERLYRFRKTIRRRVFLQSLETLWSIVASREMVNYIGESRL